MGVLHSLRIDGPSLLLLTADRERAKVKTAVFQHRRLFSLNLDNLYLVGVGTGISYKPQKHLSKNRLLCQEFLSARVEKREFSMCRRPSSIGSEI